MSFKDKIKYLNAAIDYCADKYQRSVGDTYVLAQGYIRRAWIRAEIGTEEMLSLQALLRQFKRNGWIRR